MVRNSEKRESSGAGKENETTGKLEDNVDALFRLPLAEFIGARKTLAAQLKQVGRGNEADRVKALVKPSISAWTVNQLYWKHRDAFDRLLATGQRFRKGQTSGLAGKVAEMRIALEARREALADLEHLATALLGDAGHNPSSDTVRRISTTLEAMSAYASLPDAASPGRLSHDVDPPGFESLASFIPDAGMTERTKEPARVTHSQKSVSAATNTRRKAAPVGNVRQLEEKRQARIAAAKVSLQDAKRVLIAARARAQRAQETRKKADANAKEAEKHRRAAEQRFEKARAAAEDAVRRARTVTAEVEEAVKAVEDAERTVEKASKDLDSTMR
jgi:hypothetical protein